MPTRPRRALVSLSVLLLVASACSSSGSKKGAATTTTRPATPTTSKVAPKKIGHVFVINLENENFDATWGASSPAKYLNQTLRPKGQLLTQYFGIAHASLGNYLAQISGQAPNPKTQGDCLGFVEFESTGTGAYGQALGQGCVYPKSVETIGGQLRAAGRSWKAYQEDIANSKTQPKTCRHPDIGSADSTILPTATDMYATRHDPWVYFHSVIDRSDCNAHVVGLDALTADLGSEVTTPDLAYITPNVCNDGHDAPCKDGRPGGLTSADLFLKTWVPRVLASPAYKSGGMLVITLDEAELGGADGDASACCNTPPSPNTDAPGIRGPGGGRVGTLVLSTLTKPGTTNDTPYNHYALLCSLEDLFGLDHLGFAGVPGLTCFGKDVYNAG
jgi:hypothetical protein